MTDYILALDQGTTSSRAIIFDRECQIVQTAQREFLQIFPRAGWVEHDPEAIWASQLECARSALELSGIEAQRIAAIGITNQRETTVLWDRKSGDPVANAIVWQDTRTEPYLAQFAASQASIRRKTGLPLSTYFSSLKIRWLLDNIKGLRERARAGEILFGTIDSFLAWRLTGGASGGVHSTDVTNASRTQLLNLESCDWDDELLQTFDIPRHLLPQVRACPNMGVLDAHKLIQQCGIRLLARREFADDVMKDSSSAGVIQFGCRLGSRGAEGVAASDCIISEARGAEPSND